MSCKLSTAPCDAVEAVPATQVETDRWHRVQALESGTLIQEMKDGAYEPIGARYVMDIGSEYGRCAETR